MVYTIIMNYESEVYNMLHVIQPETIGALKNGSFDLGNWYTTNELEKIEFSLVDYIANGYIVNHDGEHIPCLVGFTDLGKYRGIEPTHIFIENDGFTESGTAYYKETIRL